MKAQAKYNLLLIHDDGETKSFRISRRAMLLLLLIAVLLPVVGGLGVWAGWETWKRGRSWDQEERILQQELVSLRMQLDRLSNIEKLVQMHDSGAIPNTAPGTIAPGNTAPGNTAPGNIITGDTPLAEGGAVSGTAENGTAQAPAAVNGLPEGAGAENAEHAVVTGDLVRLDAVSALLVDGRRLRVRMDLYNESGRQIAGKLLLYILTADGQRTPLVHNDPTFRISRMKKFVTASVIPEIVTDMTNASLLVEVVNSDSELLSRQIYPIAD